ncbi:hypothetical protein PHYPSEUDO_013084 [Phytophthora pseudosyringae]|uniref:START domain-containing protein n=1 Tax=Phytophthora pseudosyringae TaxID=221518 RepID=A0A8T1W7F0_9STRA|nr:hypothetical protein PHYPSEUDO_013084 [Phytophthora pseudosyringae]
MAGLSPADRELCRDMTLKVLDRALHDYADTASWASGSSCSRFDAEHEGWRKLRSQGTVAMYAERTTDLDLAGATAMRDGGWHHPVAVVAVGRMSCSLEDVLYGLVASDPAEFKLRSVLMDRNAEDDVAVEAITVPSEGDPFQFMGVTRHVVNRGCFHRPHEFVLVSATGEVHTSCGEHLGYEVCQSVSMSRWPVNSTATRKQLIQARVLRELPDGSVGVYYKVIVDSRNLTPDYVVQASLWHAVQDFWKTTPRCADAKKLCYCVEHRHTMRLSARHSPCGSTCGVCGSPLVKGRRGSLGGIATSILHGATGSAFSLAYRCALCSASVCSKSRCCSMRQLVRIDRSSLDTNRQTVAICTCCAEAIRSENSTEIARRGLQEVHASFKEKLPPYAGSCGKHRAPAS